MPASPENRCFDDEERRLRRRASFRRYRERNAEMVAQKNRRRMAARRAGETEAEAEVRRAKHREANRRYRDQNRERIAHKARHAAYQKDAALGKVTKRRPKARQYWSDPELMTEESQSEGDDGW